MTYGPKFVDDKLVRKYLVVFGGLFNNLYIQRTHGSSTRLIKVPILYGPKEKMVRRLISDDFVNGKDTRVKITLPTMAYNLVAINPDTERQLGPLNVFTGVSVLDGGKLLTRKPPVPIELNIELAWWARRPEDAFSIFQQITSRFSPTYTLGVNNLQFQNVITEVPISLSATHVQDEFEGSYDQDRVHQWVQNFIIKAWIFGPIVSQDTITDAEISIVDIDTGEVLSEIDIEQISTDFNTCTGEGISTTIRNSDEQP